VTTSESPLLYVFALSFCCRDGWQSVVTDERLIFGF
jgi:hypothetical protein